MLNKTSRTIGLLRKLQILLPRAEQKAFVRPHLDYGDILYDQVFNASFHEARIHSPQCLPRFNWSNKEHLQSKRLSGIRFLELGIRNESLQIRWWYKKLCLFYKIYKIQSPSYLGIVHILCHQPMKGLWKGERIWVWKIWQKLIWKSGEGGSHVITLRQHVWESQF